MIVVDASVAVKWLLPEDGDVLAKAFLKSEEKLIAPAIIRVEVADAVLRQWQSKRASDNQARAACDYWDKVLKSGALQLIPSEELFELALSIAFEARHDLAGCLYIAAGKKHGAGIITADPILYERGKAVVHGGITFLDGVGPSSYGTRR